MSEQKAVVHDVRWMNPPYRNGRGLRVMAPVGTPLAEMEQHVQEARVAFHYWLDLCEPEETVFL
jgi:hypothetical protein